ncbi:hypothetical protein [Halorarum salinum]|uniref:hypothetical protein n=1 Tax=Halorarum salinum TaxID=2743089 RepID=UPI001C52CDB8|nr:hypothetical protein [Halobaculum salinum]
MTESEVRVVQGLEAGMDALADMLDDAPAESAEDARGGVAFDAEAIRTHVHETLTSAGVDAPTRPASAKLVHDQADLLVDVLEGFPDRRALLEWQQDLVIQTVGQLEDAWYSRTAADSPTVSALLGRPWGTVEEMPAELALEVRRGMVAKDLLPAFHAAHEVARWAAVERVDHLDDDRDGDDVDPIDPLDQQYPLMRPAFGELDGQQAAALGELLEGFAGSEALLAWSLRVVGASYANIDRETVTAPYFERPLRRRLIGTDPTPEDMFVREGWAAEYLLPAFNRAADALGKRASEVTAARGFRGETGTGSIT